MNAAAVLRHAVDTVLLALLFTAGPAMLLLGLSVAVPDLLLPAATVLAVVTQFWRRERIDHVPGDGGAILLLTAAVLLTAAGIMAWGSMATPSRFWDGAAMWDVKAGLLTDHPGIGQPAFRDPGVLCHSRDYPLLQPLLLALLERTTGCGRLLFPILYLMQAALVLLGARRGGAPAPMACLLALAFGLTPMVMNPTSGGFDSGYADAFLAMAVTATVAGLVAGDRLWLVTGIVLAVLVKPEGLPYAAIAMVVTWFGGARTPLQVAAVAWVAALTMWLPVQDRLQDPGGDGSPGAWLSPAAGLVFAGVLLVSQRWIVGAPGRTRALVLAALGVGCLVALPFGLAVFGGGSSTLAAYGGSPMRAIDRLPRLPEIAFGLLDHAVLRGQFGVAFVLPIVAAIGLVGRRQRNPAAMHWLLVIAVFVPVPFLLSPLDDLQHHLRSSMARLLFHHLGAAFLAAGVAIASLREEAVGDAVPACPPASHSM